MCHSGQAGKRQSEREAQSCCRTGVSHRPQRRKRGLWESPRQEGSPGTGRSSRGLAGPAQTPAGLACSYSGPLWRRECNVTGRRAEQGMKAQWIPLTRSIPRLLGPTAYLCPQHLDSRKDKSLSLWFSKEELRLWKRNFARLLGWGPANRQRQTTCRSLSLRSLRTSPCPTCPKFPLPSYCLAKRAQESTKSQGPQVTILARTQ